MNKKNFINSFSVKQEIFRHPIFRENSYRGYSLYNILYERFYICHKIEKLKESLGCIELLDDIVFQLISAGFKIKRQQGSKNEFR